LVGIPRNVGLPGITADIKGERIMSNCIELSCPVHFRNDSDATKDQNFPEVVTYVGEYAVMTTTGVDETKLSPMGALFTLLEIASSGSSEIAKSVPMIVDHYVFKVGHGAISDAMDMGLEPFHFTNEPTLGYLEHTNLVDQLYAGETFGL
jgi:hypothetical protein